MKAHRFMTGIVTITVAFLGLVGCGGSGGGGGGGSASLTSIAVTPATPSIAVGASQQFTAIGTYSDNSTQDITSQAAWSSSSLGVAAISGSGFVTGVTAGTSIITASSGTTFGSTTLTVGGGSSTKTTLVSGEINISALAVDATNVYWVESQSGTGGTLTGTMFAKKVGLNGGTPTTLASDTGPNYVSTWSIAVDSSAVYWTESDALQERVEKVGLNGGPATILDNTGSLFLTADASNIYYTNQQAMHTSTIEKMAKGGGGAAPIASGLTDPYNIVVNATDAYWVDDYDNSGTIYTVPLSGGTAAFVVIVPSISNCGQSLAVDASNLYWVDNLAGTVNKRDLASGTNTVLASGQSLPCTIAVDASNVYWSNTAAGLYKVGIGGGAVTTILPSPDAATYLALDSTYLYWTDGSAIYKIAK